MFNLINRIVHVWAKENNVSSDGQAMQVELLDLEREDEKGLYGKLVEIDGPAHGGMDSCSIFQPDRKVTSNCFDKGQIYNSLDSVQRYLTALGVNLPMIFSDESASGEKNSGAAKAFPVRAHANAVSDLNAWYSPQSKDLTFGTYGDMNKGQDRWHLAADNDVSIHEFGHLVLDQINPQLGRGWQGDGGAIHEGFGDALASLYANDSAMSEDFAVAMGRKPNKEDGLRNVDNNLTMKDVGTEEHDKGQVYGAFFWSIKKAIADPNGEFKMDERQAADLALRILFMHAALYTTSKPTSVDFVNAVIRSVDMIKFSSSPPFIDAGKLKSAIMAEARRRQMLTPQKRDDGAFEPSHDSAVQKAGYNARFVPLKKTPFSGGSYEIHQQQYRTSRGVYIDVVGADIYTQKDRNGRTVLISSADVRTIKSGEINETVTVSPAKAVQLAATDAQKRMMAAEGWTRTLWGKKPGAFIDTLAVYQMDHKMAETALQKLSSRDFSRADVRLSIIPGSSDMHYEMKVGLGIYYINARTGDVQFKKDVFVN